MKKLILLIFLLIPAIALSQGKPGMSADCIKYLSYYQQDYKAKKFVETDCHQGTARRTPRRTCTSTGPQ